MPYLHLHLIIHVAFDPHVYVGVSVCVCVCQCVCVCVCVAAILAAETHSKKTPSIMNRSIQCAAQCYRPPIALDLIQSLLIPVNSIAI